MSHEPPNRTHRALAAVRACPFDLAARAELAIAGCTGLTNPQRDGQPYTYAELHTEPPAALHAPWDYGDSAGRLLEALTLLRSMDGSSPDFHDEGLARLLRHQQRHDGLLELPAEPWTGPEPVIEMEWTQRGALMAWTTRYLAMDDQDALHRARELVHALHRVAVCEGDMAWFPSSTYPVTGWKDTAAPKNRTKDILTGAQIILPLVRFADATEDGEALHLALGLIRFLREQSGAFDAEGRMTEFAARYLHSTANFLNGVLKYALMTREDELIAWTQKAYDHLRAYTTEFGFVPHRTHGADRHRGDVCALKDMMEIALQLGLHVDPAYLTVAERYGRNHLLECQILDLDWVYNHAGTTFCTEIWHGKHPPEGVTKERVCERALGAFAGWCRPNDAFDPLNPRLMSRSTAAGSRALYAMWHYAVTRHETTTHVNLHFSRDSRYATVTSHLPCEGHLDVTMKVKGTLGVRAPEGVKGSQIEITVNKARLSGDHIRNGFLIVEGLKERDTVTVKWPQEEHTRRYEGLERSYLGYWRGDTLLKIDPPGQLTPLYRRSHRYSAAPPHHTHGMIKEIASL